MSEKDIDIQQGQEHNIADISELVNPFPGLRPFGVEESHLFFGREGQSDEALVKLAHKKFVAILGASGSGKSSFMFCGLIPTLHGGFMTEAGSNWRIVTTRPGGGPIDNLAEALLTKDQEYNQLSEEDKLIKKTIIGTVLRSSSLGLVEVIKQLRTDDFQNVLILVDQFEELFRFSKQEASSSDQNESAAFINLLLEAANQTEEPIYVSLTMRSDFIGECARYLELTQLINDSHYLIPQMVRDQKRMIIEGPVAVGGGKIAPRLTQQLLNDVGDNPDALPILQHALMRTWSYWADHRKQDEPMDLRHYTAIGTLRQALSQHANEAYDSLNKREKQICEVMFKTLTEKGAENTGIRRPTKLNVIASIAGCAEEEVERVVDRFREPGRSLLMPPHGVRLESDTVVDISHESLMRIWDRLKQWLDEEARATEMYVKLAEAARRFQEGKASLWQMPDLQLALNWREENKPTLVWGGRIDQAFERAMVFLETSEKAFLTEQRNKELLQKRKVKFMRISALILGAATMVSIFFVVFANIQTNFAKESAAEAKKQELLAKENAKEAERQSELAQTEATNARIAENQANTARKEAEIAEADAIVQRDRATAQKRLADIARDEAEAAKEVADEQRAEAERQTVIAEEQTDIANNEKEKAQRLRYQAVAQSMSIKAKGVPDPQLKGLISKQGYDYYQVYKDPDKEFNGDVYAGAYYGLQGLIGDRIYKSNPAAGQDAAAIKGDSALNQYHGHKPLTNFESQVDVRSITFSQDGQRMYSAGGDGKLLQWNIIDRSFNVIYSTQKVDRVVTVSPDEKWLALATEEGEIDLFEFNNLSKPPKKLRGHKGAIYDLVFYPDNSGFISVGADKEILSSDFETETELASVTSIVKTLTISPDGSTLAAGAANGEVILIDLNHPEATQKQIFRRRQKELPVQDLMFSSNGKYLAIGGFDITTGNGYVVIWDMDAKTQYGPVLGGFTSPVNAVEFSKDDKLVAAASSDKTARFWDMDPDNIYELPTVLDDHSDWVLDLSFHPDGNSLMTASADGIIRRFPVQPDVYIKEMCGYLNRNLSDVEWRQFVAEVSDIPWVETCEGKRKPTEDD